MRLLNQKTPAHEAGVFMNYEGLEKNVVENDDGNGNSDHP